MDWQVAYLHSLARQLALSVVSQSLPKRELQLLSQTSHTRSSFVALPNPQFNSSESQRRIFSGGTKA